MKNELNYNFVVFRRIGVFVNKEFILKKMRFAKKTKHPPAFDQGMSLRVRAIKGTVAFLSCIVKNLENESVNFQLFIKSLFEFCLILLSMCLQVLNFRYLLVLYFKY